MVSKKRIGSTQRVGVLIDYETRSKVDIKVHGNSRYARDPSTEVMCLCAVDVFADGQRFRVDRSTKRLYDFRDTNDPICEYLPGEAELMFAFNAGFEYLITTETLGIEFPIENVYCLQMTTLYNGLPANLDDVSKAVPLKAPKDEEGHRLMIKMCKPDKKTGEFPYSDEMQDRLLEYCDQDIEAEAEILERLNPVPEDEMNCFRETLRMNLEGVPVDLELTQKAADLTEVISAELQAKYPDINLRSHTQIKKFTSDHGYTLKSTDKEHVAQALQDPLCPKPVKELLEVKAAGVGSSSVSKFDAVMNFTDSDATLRMAYRHHGAVRTGRWTSQGVQIQNLPRGEKYIVEPDKATGRWHLPEIREYIRTGDLDSLYMVTNGKPMDAMRSVIRTLFAPPKGKKFVDRDLSAIEARLVVFLAQGENLKIFEDFDNGTGEEPYMIMANMIGADRFLGKVTTLSSGYGCGASTFVTMLSAMGVKIDEYQAKACLEAYKEMFPEVKAMWDLVGGAAKDAIETPMNVFEVATPNAPIKFIHDGKTLRMKLPSGRVIHYWDAKMQRGDYGPEITYMTHGAEGGKAMGWHRTRTWGGSLVGHATQASAACILRHIIRQLCSVGIEPTMLIHDEIVCTVDDDLAQGVFDKMGEIMKQPPAWAKGLPVQSAGWIGDFFVKD